MINPYVIVGLVISVLVSEAAELSVSESRVPTSPAFSLLGINPTAVEYPSTPMELGASLAAALNDANAGSLRNLAIEFSPYWWTENSQNLSYDEYYNLLYVPANGGESAAYRNKPQSEQNIMKNVYQTLTFSLASAETKSMEDSTISSGTGVAFGFRTTLIKGQLSKKALESRLQLRNLDRRTSSEMKLVDGQTMVPDGLYKELMEAEESHAANLAYLAGFQVELAGGGMVDAEDENFDNTEFRRAGAWLNASYRSPEVGGLLEQFALVGTSRYFYTEALNGDRISSVDLGARISWISQTEKLPFTLSGEYVRRINSNGIDDTDRLGVVATVKLSDRYSLFLSHGSNLEQDVLSDENTVTFLGLSVLLKSASTREGSL